MITAERNLHAQAQQAPRLLEPIPFALLDEPLDYIFADHFRQRTVCALLRRFAAARQARRAEADSVVALLSGELETHHLDEDEDLFPALRRRALPEDNLGTTLARLTEDHRLAEPMLETVIAALTARPADDPVRFSKAECEVMQAYAAREHRHLAIENGVVLAIARIRLTRPDLRAMSHAMKARRGVGLS